MKTCSDKNCTQINPQNEENFYKNKAHKDGLQYKCKNCDRERAKKNFADNIHKRHLNQKQYRTKNRENKLDYNKKYYKANQKKSVLYARDYRRNNKEKVRQSKRKYESNKTKTDPLYKLLKTLRSLIRMAMKGKDKSVPTLELLGCSIIRFKQHLESTFYTRKTNNENMTLKNHGPKGWHIDHIRPCSDFDLSNPEEQKKCFHYTNLQALWAEDNWSKSDKIY